MRYDEFNCKEFADLLILLASNVNPREAPENRAVSQGDQKFYEDGGTLRRMYDLMLGNPDTQCNFIDHVYGESLGAQERALVFLGLGRLECIIANEGAEAKKI